MPIYHLKLRPGSPEASFTLEAEDPDSVTLTDSSVGKTSARACYAKRFRTGSHSTRKLVFFSGNRVSCQGSGAERRPVLSGFILIPTPLASGATAGPDITEIPLSDPSAYINKPRRLRHGRGLRNGCQRCRTLHIHGFGCCGGAGRGPGLLARVILVQLGFNMYLSTNRDLAFEAETGSPEASFVVETAVVQNRDLAFEAENRFARSHL